MSLRTKGTSDEKGGMVRGGQRMNQQVDLGGGGGGVLSKKGRRRKRVCREEKTAATGTKKLGKKKKTSKSHRNKEGCVGKVAEEREDPQLAPTNGNNPSREERRKEGGAGRV